MSKRAVIFGLDGATFTVLDHLIQHGALPTFQRVFGGGTRGILESSIPPLTPPAWTSLVTGRTPANHGIFNFLQYESKDSSFVRMVTSRAIRTETLWSMVNRHGVRACALNFVVHNPAPKIDGCCIPGWVPWRWVKTQSHPKGIIDTLRRTIPGFDVKEMAMNFSEEEKAISGTFHEDYEQWIDLHIRREKQWFSAWKHCLEHEPAGLYAIVFDGVDKLQHLCWPFLDPAYAPRQRDEKYERVRERCWDYFRLVDDFLRQTLEIVGPETHVFIASDHGFTGTHEILYINNWLEKQGYLTWAEGTPIEEDESHELGAVRPIQRRGFNFVHTRAYASFASCNGVFIPIRGERGREGVAPEDYRRVRDQLADDLLHKCAHPETREPLVTRVWTREQAFPGAEGNANAPDLTLELRDKGNVSVLRASTWYKPRQQIMGCHHPDGIFGAIGPGIRAGTQAERLRLIDIAPTVLYALGLPIPSDLEGRVATGVFSQEYRDANPVRSGEPTRPVNARDAGTGGEGDSGGEEDPQVLMRLKALGYIE